MYSKIDWLNRAIGKGQREIRKYYNQSLCRKISLSISHNAAACMCVQISFGTNVLLYHAHKKISGETAFDHSLWREAAKINTVELSPFDRREKHP